MARKRYHGSHHHPRHEAMEGSRMHEPEHDRMEKKMEREEHAHLRPLRGRDEGMISEDHKEMANLPQHPVMKPYARFPKGINGPIDDTIARSDEMEYDNLRSINRYKSKDKY